MGRRLTIRQSARLRCCKTVRCLMLGTSAEFLQSFRRLQPDLDCLSRQPFCSKAFVVCMEFWLGLAVRYRLPRRKRVESPSLELVRNLLLGRPLRLDHLLFPSARVRLGGGSSVMQRSGSSSQV